MNGFTFRGVCSTGRSYSGHRDDRRSVAAFVEARFDARWKSLTVWRGDVQVGGIERHPAHPRRRTWWAEWDES